MLHRPGPELKRLTPRNNDKLLFDGIPWVGRAQDEHDALRRGAARPRDVEVLYLMDLLTETLEQRGARVSEPSPVRCPACTSATPCAGYLTQALHDQCPEELAGFLTAGVRNDEVRGGHGLVTSLLASDDFLIDPLPNLLFTRDSSVWVRDRVAITSLAMPARERETQLTELIYTEHPRFRGTPDGARVAARARRGRRRTAARPRRHRGRRRRAHHAGRRRAAGPPGARRPSWPTPCSPYRSPRSGPPCTSTPSARWSTSTRS